MTQRDDVGGWTFLSNHALILTLVSDDPDIRVRDIAAEAGITERSAHEILRQLADGGYLLVEKHGRRNHYRVVTERPLRHRLHRSRHVSELLAALAGVRDREGA